MSSFATSLVRGIILGLFLSKVAISTTLKDSCRTDIRGLRWPRIETQPPIKHKWSASVVLRRRHSSSVKWEMAIRFSGGAPTVTSPLDRALWLEFKYAPITLPSS